MNAKKTNYIDNDILTEEVKKSQDSKVPTEQLCTMLREIAAHLLGDSRYRRYPKDMKEDMCSAALIKCLKNVKNFDSSKGTAFNYFTRCTEWSFWQSLGLHYRQVNLQRKICLLYANEIEDINPALAQQIRDTQIETEE